LPFAEDEHLVLQFKLWARSDLEHLTVGKAAIWVNEDLLNDWTTQQLRNYQISYPVSNYVVGRWMREAGFRYAGHKKSYYVDRHKDDDVVEDRNRNVVVFQDEELYEHCWVQLPKAVHLKHKSKRKKERNFVKKEGRVKQEGKVPKIKSEPLDASSEIAAYLEQKSTITQMTKAKHSSKYMLIPYMPMKKARVYQQALHHCLNLVAT
jgi:hypothetical protein